ncbi:MAG: ATP-binding protein [Chitinispirillales bacterium]|nr:ATP-binding protein [Chitinispirillales bacterium]
MKYISEEQWNKLLCDFADFRKGSGASEKANKGQLFEYIVEYLLENLFGKKIKFKATKASYDGSKDFWAVDEQFKLWWAECKNYSDNISLTQLAPTLFMAELNEVNNLLFFSYSELNQNMKRRIGQYAARHQKDIYIYDDTILEQLIFSYMPPKLKEEYIPTDFETEKPTAEIVYFDEKNPVISDSVGFSGYYDIDELRVGIVYNLNVLVISKNLTKGCDVTASIVQDNDMSYFEFLSHPNTTVCDVKQIKFSVQPCQAVLGSFQVRLIKRKNKIKMPKICLDIKTGGHITQDESHIDQKYDCVINNKDAIIGAHYEKIINKVSDNCLNKEKVTGFMVYGGSGTGKTRILEECYANLIRQDYRILNFIGFDINNDWKNVVREIVFYIYGVQDDIALAVLCEALNMVESPQHIDRDKQTLLKFLPLLNRSETTLAELRPYYSIIFEKMRRSKYAIVIDNLQSYTHDLPQFLNEMLQFYLNCNRSVPVCLMVSINTELIFDEAISTFMSEIIRLKSTSHGHFCCEEIKGFMTEEQAVIFLGKLLCMNDFPRDLSMARNILTKVSLRPKYLEQVANYLIDKEAVRITNGIGIAISYEKLYQTLETAPIDFRTIFHVNYKHMIRIYDGFAEEAKNIVALLYFLGSLTSEYIKAFNVSADVLLILCNHGIIENRGASGFPKYVFEHDLIEICISQDIYQDILEIAVNLVLQHEYALNTYLSAKR